MITWQVFELCDDGVDFGTIESVPAEPGQYGPLEAVAAAYGTNVRRFERCGPREARFIAIRPASEGCAERRDVAFYVRHTRDAHLYV